MNLFHCSLIFDAGSRFCRDAHQPTREHAKHIFVQLLKLNEFWRLYFQLVSERDRAKVNVVLSKIRKGVIITAEQRA